MEYNYPEIENLIRDMTIEELQRYKVAIEIDLAARKMILQSCEEWLTLKKRVRDINNGGPKT